MAFTTTTSSSSLFLLIISLAFSLLSLLYSTIDCSGNNDHLLLVHILGLKDEHRSFKGDVQAVYKLFEEVVTTMMISKEAGEDEAASIITKSLLFVLDVRTNNDVMYDEYLLPLREIHYNDISSPQFSYSKPKSFIQGLANTPRMLNAVGQGWWRWVPPVIFFTDLLGSIQVCPRGSCSTNTAPTPCLYWLAPIIVEGTSLV